MSQPGKNSSAIAHDSGEFSRRRSSGLANSVILQQFEANKAECPFVAEKLTSAVFNTVNPPKDWCDVSLLIPHEGIRLEINHLVASVEAMKTGYDDNEAWRVLNFARWFEEIFAIMIHSHHDNEELIYFPFIATRAKLPEEKMSNDHGELVSMLNDIVTICKTIIKKKGQDCSIEIKDLQVKVPPFAQFMDEHLQEEEEVVPDLLRQHFTVEEEQAAIEEILKRDGLNGLRIFLPSILTAMNDWASPEFVEEFQGAIPSALRLLYLRYFEKVYFECVVPMRDSPLLETKPKLGRRKMALIRKFWLCV